MGGKPDPEPVGTQRLDLRDVLLHRLLTEPGEPAARVRDVQEHEVDPGGVGRLGRRHGLGHAEVVELARRGVAGSEHLPVRPLVLGPHESRGLALRLGEHRLAPRPEVRSRTRVRGARAETCACGR